VPRQRRAALAIDEDPVEVEVERPALVAEPRTRRAASHQEAERSVVAILASRLGWALLRAAAALGRIAWRRPFDAIGTAAAAAATVAIVVNALFLQASPHPAPMLPGNKRPIAEATGSVVPMLPRPRPAARDAAASDAQSAPRQRAQLVSDLQRELSRRGFFDGPVDGIYGAKTDAAIRDFEQAAGMKPSAQPDEALLRAVLRSSVVASVAGVPPVAAKSSPAAPKGAPSVRRILAVQRALADYGYGQLRPNGMLGPETKAAIERFERERKLPVTGQISDRLARELAAVTGRPLD